MAVSSPTRGARYEWTPAFWKGWRERSNFYRDYKSQRDRELAVELLDPKDGERILEVGCGYGWISQALWDAARIDWTGMDRSESMLGQLRAESGGRALIQGDASQLPLGDAQFDKVLCSGVLMHVEEDDAALAELARVLRPGGRLVFSFNNILSPYALAARLNNTRKKGFIQRFRRPGNMRKKTRELGLELERVMGDGIIATVPYCFGRFSIPPQSAYRIVQPLDHWAVTRFPALAFEVWYSARKTPAGGARIA